MNLLLNFLLVHGRVHVFAIANGYVISHTSGYANDIFRSDRADATLPITKSNHAMMNDRLSNGDSFRTYPSHFTFQIKYAAFSAKRITDLAYFLLTYQTTR